MTISLRFARTFAVPAALLVLLSLSATAQRGGGGRAPGGVAISPDGTMVAWSLGSREGSQIHITDVANPDPAKDKIVAPAGTSDCSNGSPMWSPDGQWLAYTSTCTGKEEKPVQPQIFLWSRASGESKQLTHVTGNFHEAAWSPDGKSIAFLFVENATRSAGALDAMKPWSGVIGEDGVEIQRIYAVDVADGKGEWFTPAKLHVYEFGWAPDSREITYTAANPPGENNWWVADIYRQTRGGEPKVVFDPAKTSSAMHGLQIAVSRYSPDGKHIAFIGGLMSDQGSTGGDVWIVDAKGGQPVDVTPGIDGTPTFEGWFNDHRIGFVEDRSGHTLFVGWDPDKKEAAGTPLDLGEVRVGGGAIKDAVSVSDKDIAAFVMSGPKVLPEVWTEHAGKLTQLTHLNDAAPKSTARIESLEWDNEGFHVQGWLTYPTNYDPHKKYPMIVTVHGGPSASAFPRGAGQWSALGYFELQPNPRGSFGEGEKFTAANIKDFGYGDLRDILAGIDAVEKKVSIDNHRVGLTGWSYGGFMSMFAETQTNRFRAIVAGAGLSDWLSYYGENSIDQWMIPFFGASVYDDPAVYARSSAITFIKKAKTPMLIIVGDRDGECPAPQSFEMWHALKDLGVKTQLVVYPNEGHGFRDPAHIRDRNERTVKWFADNMPPGQ
ncbi:MAG TPA: S9 family peptidase [Acidobacteriaceae bacterium]|nr:S9 family peptidase [Acidobacteriaceae bacterium]